MKNTQENEIAALILASAEKLHRTLGIGLSKETYQECLNYELQKQGHKVELGKPVNKMLCGYPINVDYKMDMLIDDKVLVEVRSAEEISSHDRQAALTYLRINELKVGLVLNFYVIDFKDGILLVENDWDSRRIQSS